MRSSIVIRISLLMLFAFGLFNHNYSCGDLSTSGEINSSASIVSEKHKNSNPVSPIENENQIYECEDLEDHVAEVFFVDPKNILSNKKNSSPIWTGYQFYRTPSYGIWKPPKIA